MTGAHAELLRITPGPAFADDLLDALRARAGAGGGSRSIHHAIAIAAVAAGGATFYGLVRLHRRGGSE